MDIFLIYPGDRIVNRSQAPKLKILLILFWTSDQLMKFAVGKQKTPKA